jgi:hypothetical protein
MEWRTSGRPILALAAILIPATFAGCEMDDARDDGPPDLPGPIAQAIDAPGPFPIQLLPPAGELTDGIAVEPLGSFVVTAALDADPIESVLSMHYWNEEEERWGEPRQLHFSEAGFGDSSPALAPDGSYLLFASARPGDNPAAGDVNIWIAQREGESDGEIQWTDPWLVPAVFSPAWDGAPSLAGDGSLYFSSMREGPTEGLNLHVAPFEDGMWMAPQKLPEPVNSSVDDSDPYISPDQSFMVFASNREGLWNLYLVHAEGEGWGEPQLLDAASDESANDRAPYMTAAGSHLFWVRDGEVMAAPAEAVGIEARDTESEVARAGAGEG